jgi:hypothetical protein
MPGELGTQISERDVGLSLQCAQDHSGMRLDPSRAAITALPLGRRVAHRLRKRVPADRTGRANPEPRRRLATRRPALNRRDHTPAKINRQRPRHARPPPSPARSLNQIATLLRIHTESASSKNALANQPVQHSTKSGWTDALSSFYPSTALRIARP